MPAPAVPTFAVPGAPITPTLLAPRRGGSVVDIAYLAQGYIVHHDQVQRNGALELNTSEVEKIVEVGGQRRLSSIADMARAADAMGTPDGSVTAAEFANLMSRFDVGNAGRPNTAGDGFLEGSEDAAWGASGQFPTSHPVAG